MLQVDDGLLTLCESIVVTVVRLGGDKVRIGIEAPPEMLVLRDELEVHECLEKSA